MSISSHRYDNGLELVVEPIDGVASVGMTLLLAAGSAVEPADKLGIGAVVSEMIFRGAGDRDARAHSDALDLAGVHRSSEVQTHHMRLGALFLGERIGEALPLLFDMARRPHLNDKDLAPAVELALQSIAALEDDPQDKVMIELRRRHLGDPLGRPHEGDPRCLRGITISDVKRYVADRFVADGAILSFAGAVEFERVRDQVGRLLGDMGKVADGVDCDASVVGPTGYAHLSASSAQQHIGLAYETVGELDDQSTTQRLAVAVLSGGMSGRLFTEVREVRGLCYSVYATYAPRRKTGTVYAYAGTTNERSAETLEVLTAELRRLSEGVEADEFERAVVGHKARLVMQGESTSARARAIAHDQFLLGKPRTLEERAAAVDRVTLAQLNAFVAGRRPGELTTLTVGPEPLVSLASGPT